MSATPTPEIVAPSPVGTDIARASIPRVYDYSLGGKDNYAVDREALGTVLQVAPGQREVSLANRRWQHRVVRYLAEQVGLEQFLDIGAGLPRVGNTHEIAQLGNPRTTVVYVDNDPVCAAHGRALLERNERTHYVLADFLDAGTLLGNPAVTQYFELDRPIGVLACGVLQHIGDDLDPAGVMGELIDRLPVGSYVAVSHFYDQGEEHPEIHRVARDLEAAFTDGVGSGWYRTREEILEFLTGLEVEPPGLVELDDWWPLGPPKPECERSPEERTMRGGLGCKRPPLLRLARARRGAAD
ncbi:SAM-dependent methyltransferase [Nocardia sp. CA-290969]|uniref:SAM-dependent methyltransferase n=1 Tax=Nocardia sp. CA-290969 TaxID=3239986 RepID=UPI003D8F6F56